MFTQEKTEAAIFLRKSFSAFFTGRSLGGGLEIGVEEGKDRGEMDGEEKELVKWCQSRGAEVKSPTTFLIVGSFTPVYSVKYAAYVNKEAIVCGTKNVSTIVKFKKKLRIKCSKCRNPSIQLKSQSFRINILTTTVCDLKYHISEENHPWGEFSNLSHEKNYRTAGATSLQDKKESWWSHVFAERQQVAVAGLPIGNKGISKNHVFADRQQGAVAGLLIESIGTRKSNVLRTGSWTPDSKRWNE